MTGKAPGTRVEERERIFGGNHGSRNFGQLYLAGYLRGSREMYRLEEKNLWGSGATPRPMISLLVDGLSSHSELRSHRQKLKALTAALLAESN
jgi:hypothetical protein